MKASKVTTNAFGGNLVKDFYEKVNFELYDIAREKGTCNFEIDSSFLSAETLDFMKKNEIPFCKVGMKQTDEWHYEIIINGKNWNELDWEVSDKVVKAHSDDYEISKDEMYGYDDFTEDDFDESKYFVTEEDY